MSALPTVCTETTSLSNKTTRKRARRYGLSRGLMIGFGAALIHSYEWILYIFAAFLIFTGIKMLFANDEGYNIAE
ncbi:hypothetical protein CBG02_08670, partial [Streptococcus pyogenes]